VLTSRDIHTRNTFERPEAVQPVRDENLHAGSPFVYRFAPASVTRLDLDLN
jgi:alpha-L-arabinofuranosidase